MTAMNELLKRELSAGINRIISFIRQQEKDFLLPTFTDSGILKSTPLYQNQHLESIAKHLISERERTTILINRSEKTLNGLKHLVSKKQKKEHLKDEFSELLDHYITQREEMGWTTSTVKKEEFVAHIKKMLKNL